MNVSKGKISQTDIQNEFLFITKLLYTTAKDNQSLMYKLNRILKPTHFFVVYNFKINKYDISVCVHTHTHVCLLVSHLVLKQK